MAKILIVDDENSLRITLSEFLKKEGYQVDQADNGLNALEMVHACSYDLILTDIVMPNMSGIELLKRIREQELTSRIVIMTGEPTVDSAVKAVKMGANDYLMKPILKDEFLTMVKHNLSIKALTDEKRQLEVENHAYQKDLEAMVDQRTSALKKSMQSIISLLTHVVEYRDPYTSGHQVRVGNLAYSIARKMDLDESEAETIRVIGYIHDIGKIVIPTEILSKPGKLNAIEYMMIRTHSTSGYDMLVNEPLPKMIAIAIRQHHERMNGSGYPDGVKEEAIGLEAKILMVADVVEAMMTHRPYRPSLGAEIALKEIRDHAGTLYSQEVSTACLELFELDHYELDDIQYSAQLPI